MPAYPRSRGGLEQPVVHGCRQRLVVQCDSFCVGECMSVDGPVELVVVATVAIQDRGSIDRVFLSPAPGSRE